MARIPEAELDRLKREIAVERLATARGVALQPHGANLIGLCPFHDRADGIWRAAQCISETSLPRAR